MQESDISDPMEEDQYYVDETNLFDVPVTFDPTHSYFEYSEMVPKLGKDATTQTQLHDETPKEQRELVLSTGKNGTTLPVAFKVAKMPNGGIDFLLYQVDANMDMGEDNNILQGWEVKTRRRPDGRRDNFYKHTSRNRQFRSLLEVKRYIDRNLEPEVVQEQEDESFEYVRGSGMAKSFEALLVAADEAILQEASNSSSEANLQEAPNSSTENAGASQDEIDVARIVAIDLARGFIS